MSLSQIWEIAAPLVISAAAMLIVGLILISMIRKMKSGLLKNMINILVRIVLVAGPLLFLVYTLIRAAIFIFIF